MMRDFNDPKYKKWRKAVYARDRFQCQMPGCQRTDKRLNAHHVQCWNSWPQLRFAVANGVTLCRSCHEKIRGKEREYESMFLQILGSPHSDDSILLLMKRYERRPKEANEES